MNHTSSTSYTSHLSEHDTTSHAGRNENDHFLEWSLAVTLIWRQKTKMIDMTNNNRIYIMLYIHWETVRSTHAILWVEYSTVFVSFPAILNALTRKCTVYYFSATATIVDGEILLGLRRAFGPKCWAKVRFQFICYRRSSENKIWDDKAFSNIKYCTLVCRWSSKHTFTRVITLALTLSNSHYLKARIATPTPRRHATGT
jgi:hypothetical protein